MKKNHKTKQNLSYFQSVKQNMKPYLIRCPVRRMAFYRIGSRKQ